MTRTVPEDLGVGPADWSQLANIALDAGRTPHVYVGEGLILAADAARTILANRAAHKHDTTVLVGWDSIGYSPVDELEAYLKQLEEEAEELARIVGDTPVEDPKRLNIPLGLLVETDTAAGQLRVCRGSFVQMGLNLRSLIGGAIALEATVLLETAVEGSYDELVPTFL